MRQVCPAIPRLIPARYEPRLEGKMRTEGPRHQERHFLRGRHASFVRVPLTPAAPVVDLPVATRVFSKMKLWYT